MGYPCAVRVFAGVLVLASGFVQTAAAGVIDPGWIETIGVLPGGNFTTAYSVNADGSVVVGGGNSSMGTRAVRWTLAGGLEAIPGSSNGVFSVSGDGRRAGGSGVLYTVGGPTLNLGGNEIVAINGDGTSLVNTQGTSNLWRQGLGWSSIPNMVPSDISRDGTWVVGDSAPQMMRWSAATGTQILGPGRANTISDDGRTVAGDHNNRLIRWREGLGIQDLGTLSDVTAFSTTGMSGDGSVIVGTASVTPPGGTTRPIPFIWTQETGLMSMRNFLIARGISPSGWSLLELHEISSDGQTIVGFGINPDSQFTGIVIRVNGLPTPSAAALALIAAAAIGVRRRRPA